MRKINLLLIFVLLVLFNVPGLVSAKGGFSSGGGGINMGWLTADFSSINHELISMGLNSGEYGGKNSKVILFSLQ